MTPDETAATPVAPTMRRLLGIGIDWILSLLVSSAFFADPALDPGVATLPERVLLAGAPFATLGVWAAQHLLLVATLGTTIGHRVMGLRVIREDGASFVGPVKALIRTALLALVIPAVVWGPDGRGLHDRLAGTRIVRTGAAA
ncbi:RDD family protein [Demequina sp. SYSU T00039]|uniref:RDD family protein n=1 Tax=Demequina lignilytica TaxID=3051663 RepID=A0AAW7M330_9MICO|nr:MULTISPECIES: RDD family protein [unclassified Demequina]MDN4486848.1 RDD family protein [Demequina sp. SYSU T00039]MDN4489532.1 RDD family protein [Demequina sp. SYSU T00068]